MKIHVDIDGAEMNCVVEFLGHRRGWDRASSVMFSYVHLDNITVGELFRALGVRGLNKPSRQEIELNKKRANFERY